jgi:glycosyltransferase involved in cell wall biosynthesis
MNSKEYRQAYPKIKYVARGLYRLVLGVHALLTVKLVSNRKRTSVYFGGARAGDAGGPLVKVARLKKNFGENRINYNLLYVLSNCPYLPKYGYNLIKNNNIPIILNQNGVFYEAWYQGNWRQENIKISVPYHLADYVFYQSEFCKKAADKYLGARQGASEILYNAVDTKYFKPSGISTLTNEKPFTFLLTGRIGKHLYYRVESTLRGLAAAIAEGLNARLIISGGLDREVTELSSVLIKELKLDDVVIFTGSYIQSEAPRIYNSADAYVMTKHNDPCPNAVIEALSCGLPVLYSNTGGIPELVGKDAGVALECKESWFAPQVPEVKSICAGMIEITQKYEQMSASARKRAIEKFDITHWLNRHRVVFEDLLNK